MEQLSPFLGGVVLELLVVIEAPGRLIDLDEPALHAERCMPEGALVQRLVAVEELLVIERAPGSDPFAVEARALGVIEGEGVRVAGVRLSGAGEQEAQERANVGNGADRRARVPAEPPLRRRRSGSRGFDRVDVGLPVAGQAALLEQGVRVVQLALRLGADGIEHDRRLSGAGNAGKYGDLAPRDIERDVLQVVPRARRGSR